MKSVFRFLALGAMAAAGLAVTACDADDDPTPVDGVIVKSVTPNSGMRAGRATELTIQVEYTMASAGHGTLDVYFNNGTEPDALYATYGSPVEVTRGSRELVLYVKGRVAKWDPPAQSRVYVILHGWPQQPSGPRPELARDSVVLPVTD